MSEGEEKEEAQQAPCSQAMQSRGLAAATGYSAGRQKHACFRRLGNGAGVVRRWWRL